MNFSSLPTQKRMCIRAMICELGGQVAGYSGPDVIVAMPNEGRWRLISYLDSVGLTVSEIAYFPLCSDNPPENLRHHCFNHQTVIDRPGYWLYYKWRLKRKEG